MTTTTEQVEQRADEAHVLAHVPSVIAGARVMRVGRFIPGGVGTYACLRVLLRWSRVGAFEYSTHLAVYRDEQPGWIVTNGRYFPRDGYRGAAADLMTDDVERFTEWLTSRGFEIRDAQAYADGGDLRVVPMRDAVEVYANHLREG